MDDPFSRAELTEFLTRRTVCMEEWLDLLPYCVASARTHRATATAILQGFVDSAEYSLTDETTTRASKAFFQCVAALHAVLPAHSKEVLEELCRRELLPRISLHLLWWLQAKCAPHFLAKHQWIWRALLEQRAIHELRAIAHILASATDVACRSASAMIRSPTAADGIACATAYLRIYCISLALAHAPEASKERKAASDDNGSAAGDDGGGKDGGGGGGGGDGGGGDGSGGGGATGDVAPVPLRSTVRALASALPELVASLSARVVPNAIISTELAGLGQMLVWASMMTAAFLGDATALLGCLTGWRQLRAGSDRLPPLDVHAVLILEGIVDESPKARAWWERRLWRDACHLLKVPADLVPATNSLLGSNEGELAKIARAAPLKAAIGEFYTAAAVAKVLLEAHVPPLVDTGMCPVGSTIDTVTTALKAGGPFARGRHDVHEWMLRVLRGDGAQDISSESMFPVKPHPGVVGLLDSYVEACLPVQSSPAGPLQRSRFVMLPLLPLEIAEIFSSAREWPLNESVTVTDGSSSHATISAMGAMYFALRYTERARTALKPLPPPFDFFEVLHGLPLRHIYNQVTSVDPDGALRSALGSLMHARWSYLLDESTSAELNMVRNVGSLIFDGAWNSKKRKEQKWKCTTSVKSPPGDTLRALALGSSRQVLVDQGWPLIEKFLPRMVADNWAMSLATAEAATEAWQQLFKVHPAPQVLITKTANCLLPGDPLFTWGYLVREPHLLLAMRPDTLQRPCVLRIVLTMLTSLLAGFELEMACSIDADELRSTKSVQGSGARLSRSCVNPEAVVVLLEIIVVRCLVGLCSISGPAASYLVGPWIKGRLRSEKILQTILLQGLTLNDTEALISLGVYFENFVKGMLPLMLSDGQLHVQLAGVTTASALVRCGIPVPQDHLNQCIKITSSLNHMADEQVHDQVSLMLMASVRSDAAALASPLIRRAPDI